MEPDNGTLDEQEAQSTLTLKGLLARTNDPERDSLNRSFYVLTNHVGEDDNFVGADASASWWHRNFRMYALVQRYAQPGERVISRFCASCWPMTATASPSTSVRTFDD